MHVVYVNVHFRSSLCPESAVQSSGKLCGRVCHIRLCSVFCRHRKHFDKLPLRHAFEADDDVND